MALRATGNGRLMREELQVSWTLSWRDKSRCEDGLEAPWRHASRGLTLAELRPSVALVVSRPTVACR